MITATAAQGVASPYLDFYRRESISPVSQDISDLDRHFQRREALYRHLGIVPALIAGRSVVEFGPGSGHNACYTSALGPSRYVLVDGNPRGIEETRALLARHARGGLTHEIVPSLIEDFRTADRFDLVLCEAVLSAQPDAPGLARHVAGFAKPGGVIVITCMDSVSFLPESLRRVLATALLDPAASTDQTATSLVGAFAPHLRTLKGMSRSHKDWVLDSMLFPYRGRLFSIADAIAALDVGCDVYGASPSFLTDWRWYKDIHGEARRYNEVALSGFWRNLHNHLDYRCEFAPRAELENQKLLVLCDLVFDLEEHYRHTRAPETLAEIVVQSRTIARLVRSFSPSTADALEEFGEVVGAGITSTAVAGMRRFGPWFGRGQQYLSLIRK